MRLLRRHSLDIIRKSSDGHYNESGRWVGGGEEIKFSIRGNLQPYQKSLTQGVFPTGLRTQDVRLLFTTAVLRTSDDVSWQEADILVLGGIEYECFSLMDWQEQLHRTSHGEYLFIRRDKMNNVRNQDT